MNVCTHLENKQKFAECPIGGTGITMLGKETED
jgi:hypothetical protein